MKRMAAVILIFLTCYQTLYSQEDCSQHLRKRDEYLEKFENANHELVRAGLMIAGSFLAGPFGAAWLSGIGALGSTKFRDWAEDEERNYRQCLNRNRLEAEKNEKKRIAEKEKQQKAAKEQLAAQLKRNQNLRPLD